MLLFDIYCLIISILVIVVIAILNIVLVKEAIERELTFSEIIKENQDTKIGFALMATLSLPTYVVLKLWSLRPIKTAPTDNWE